MNCRVSWTTFAQAIEAAVAVVRSGDEETGLDGLQRAEDGIAEQLARGGTHPEAARLHGKRPAVPSCQPIPDQEPLTSSTVSPSA